MRTVVIVANTRQLDGADQFPVSIFPGDVEFLPENEVDGFMGTGDIPSWERGAGFFLDCHGYQRVTDWESDGSGTGTFTALGTRRP